MTCIVNYEVSEFWEILKIFSRKFLGAIKVINDIYFFFNRKTKDFIFLAELLIRNIPFLDGMMNVPYTYRYHRRLFISYSPLDVLMLNV